MDEKRVKLGIDVGELSNQLLKVNQLVEDNYKKSIQGQSEYNQILEKSIELLEKQVELVGRTNPQNSLIKSSDSINNGGGNIGGGANISMSESDIRKYLILIDRIRGTMNNPDKNKEAQNNEVESKENDLLRGILEDLDKIWEKMSEQNIPQGGVFGGGQNQQNKEGEEGKEEQNNKSNETQKQNNKQKSNNNAANAFNSAAGLVQTDPNYMVAGIVGMIPWVGAGLSSIFTRLIQEAEQKDIAQHRLRATIGTNRRGSFIDIGLKDAEAYEKLAGYYPENVYLKSSDLKFEKGFNISSGTMSSLLRSFREDVGREIGASVIGVDYLYGLHRRSGIETKEVRGYSEDYLKILVELNQKQLETTGETNSLINSNIIQGIASLDKHFGDPTVLARVIQGLEGGLTQARTPQIEALQYYAMSKANPNASIWEMQMMKENPFGAESRGYLSNFLESLLNTGNINDAKFNIMHTFGLTAHQTEDLVNGILNARREAESGNENYSKYLDEFGNFDLSKYLETADFGTTTIQRTRVQKDTRPIYEVLPELLREAGLDIKVASGYRPAGAVGTAGRNSWHWRHGAVDIIPQGNTTFEDIENAIYNNPDIYNYMLANNFGLLDESGRSAESRATMQRTGATGPHFHFGKDSGPASRYAATMRNRGIIYTPGGESDEEYIYTENMSGRFAHAEDWINQEAAAATSDVQRMVAEASNTLATAGEPVLEFTASAVNFIQDISDKMPGYIDTANNFMTDFWGTLGGYFEDLGDKIIRALNPANWFGGGRNGNNPSVNNTSPTTTTSTYMNPTTNVSNHVRH